jgi:hypothetical protein
MLVGQVSNVPEHFAMELVWLATHYADHPDYRQAWKPLGLRVARSRPLPPGVPRCSLPSCPAMTASACWRAG